jgi:hypothetical protein
VNLLLRKQVCTFCFTKHCILKSCRNNDGEATPILNLCNEYTHLAQCVWGMMGLRSGLDENRKTPKVPDQELKPGSSSPYLIAFRTELVNNWKIVLSVENIRIPNHKLCTHAHLRFQCLCLLQIRANVPFQHRPRPLPLYHFSSSITFYLLLFQFT